MIEPSFPCQKQYRELFLLNSIPHPATEAERTAEKERQKATWADREERVSNYTVEELDMRVRNYLFCPEPWISNPDVLRTMIELCRRYDTLQESSRKCICA